MDSRDKRDKDESHLSEEDIQGITRWLGFSEKDIEYIVDFVGGSEDAVKQNLIAQALISPHRHAYGRCAILCIPLPD